ncbi:MAG TPA: BREX-2 system adenine-specific DNA-methyltransferase PglX [Trebonia sp.]|nr:BREX-2 system adenine-specific DNA-methyltransferase PglX [Trebonia sp.]
MIESRTLLADLRDQVRVLEADLHRQAGSHLSGALTAAWRDARESGRTASGYGAWLDEQISQSAAAWMLATVFARFCEDNRLTDAPFLAGSEGRLALALARQQAYFRQHPDRGDRDWIVAALDALSTSATTIHLFDALHSRMGRLPISHAAARGLLAFWRRLDEARQLVHDLSDPGLNTDFLADVYADLSDQAKKTYALVRTPGFVADLILDRTVKPALDTFGPRGLRVLDPVCGSGTFLLGTFQRLMQAWHEVEPGADPWVQVLQALASVHGVDKNPFAVIICRFRLLMAAMKAGGAERLGQVPELPLIIAVGDSLIPPDTTGNSWTHTPTEDLSYFEDPAINLLGSGSYDAVVGNPPYTAVRDRDEYELYRATYPVCRGKYPLTVPFIVRFFELARPTGRRAGFTGLLVSNAFMKREFGRPLVEEFLATVDLTHVLDTSGAYIPGHGIPTVILLGRARPPTTQVVRAALGVRGEPIQPADPAAGVVWQAITRQIDDPGSESEWVVVADIDRERFVTHPWSLAGSKASDLLTAMETGTPLRRQTARIGYYAITGSDDAFTAPPAVFRRIGAEDEPTITIVTGSEVRDWAASPGARAFFPGEDAEHPIDITRFPRHMRRLWPYRTTLRNRRYLGAQLDTADSRAWYRWHHVTKTAGAHPWSLTFPWVATHPHFVLVHEGTAPLQSAPVVKLPAAASEDDFFQLLAVLNSSAACFRLKQYSQSKGAPRADQLRAEEPWEHFYEFTSSRLEELPLPAILPAGRGRALDELARRLASVKPAVLCAREVPTRAGLDAARMEHERIRGQMIALQEELDWDVYRRYGLLDQDEAAALIATSDNVPELRQGERAFEIVLARRVQSGEAETQWFARHGSTLITEIPEDWPREYRDVVAKRIKAIEHRRDIGLIEQPEYKRRWQSEPWEQMEREALEAWLLDRCEDRSLWYEPDGQPRVMTVNGLADRLRADRDVVSVTRLLAGPDTDLADVLAEIIADEHVPYLAQFRYRESGLAKRAAWQRTWESQREEDRTGRPLDIPVPPTYTSADFVKNSYWRQRGKLDAAKERFISYPMAGPGSDSLLLGWVGWDHREQAHALITLIEERSAADGWDASRLKPLLAGLIEVMPWVRQWHGEANGRFDISPAEEYDAYLATQREKYRLTEEDLSKWTAPPVRRGRPPKTHAAGAGNREAKEG